MIPQILEIFYVPVNSFGLMIALSMLAGIYILADSFKLQGIDERLADKYVLTAGFGGLLGARLWYMFVSHYERVSSDLLAAFLAPAGFTFFGGFLTGCLLLYFLSRYDKIPFLTFIDSLPPSLLLGYGIGRLGCQLSGDGDYGIVTSSIFGMSYSTGVVPTAPGVLAFPAPLYESILAFIMLYFILKFRSKKIFAAGGLFAAYLVMIGIERFLIEFIRINPKVMFGMFSEAQVIAVIISLSGLLCLYFLRSKKSTLAE